MDSLFGKEMFQVVATLYLECVELRRGSFLVRCMHTYD